MFEVNFADIGEGIHEGVIYSFEVTPGQTIEEGDTLFLVETDKVTAEIPSPVGGTIDQIHFKEGDTIHVGETIVTVAVEGSEEVSHEVVQEQGSTSVVGDLEISSELIAASDESHVKQAVKGSKKVLATPVARKLAKDLGVDIQSVQGTGPAGRVMKADIHDFARQKETEIAPRPEPVKLVDSDDVRRVPLTMLRKAIAEKMTQSKFTIPHTAVMDEIQVDTLVKYREKVKLLARQKNIKLTYLPFIIKAVAIALRTHEILNARIDMAKGEAIYHKAIHIGIAVDTPYGLTVPVIKHADQMSLLSLAEAIEDLSDRAQRKALSLDEIKGGTFTITNYGAFGSSFGVPIINHPESAILGIGKIDKKPVVIEDALQIGYVMPLSMAFDHRLIDGADAGRFLTTVKELLTNPDLLLLS